MHESEKIVRSPMKGKRKEAAFESVEIRELSRLSRYSIKRSRYDLEEISIRSRYDLEGISSGLEAISSGLETLEMKTKKIRLVVRGASLVSHNVFEI